MSHDSHQHSGHTHDVDFESPQMAAHAEAEAEVFEGLASQAIAVLADRCARSAIDVRRVLDIGSGPGVGTCYLAEQFASADVVAVDGSATMLASVAARAERLGLTSRIDTRLVDLAHDLAGLGRADVVWASMVLHHIGDEAAALGEIRRLLSPGGLLALVESARPLRIQITGTGTGTGPTPGLWDRLDAASAAWFAEMRAHLPGTTVSADYPAMLAAAGFELVADEVLTVVLDAPLDERARQFAHRHLLHATSRLADHADAADLSELDPLIDEQCEESVLRRNDVEMRASRHLYVARDPASASRTSSNNSGSVVMCG